MALPPQLAINDIHKLSQKDAFAIIERITRLERRTFPPSEAFEFTLDLWRKKPNTRVIYATPSSPKAPIIQKADTSTDIADLVAYAVYVRMKGTALLHKICVAEQHRGCGVGAQVMAYIEQRLRREGCQIVQLWVDKERTAARRLYARCGFEEMESVEDYYGKGRTGIKMALELGQ